MGRPTQGGFIHPPQSIALRRGPGCAGLQSSGESFGPTDRGDPSPTASRGLCPLDAVGGRVGMPRYFSRQATRCLLESRAKYRYISGIRGSNCGLALVVVHSGHGNRLCCGPGRRRVPDRRYPRRPVAADRRWHCVPLQPSSLPAPRAAKG